MSKFEKLAWRRSKLQFKDSRKMMQASKHGQFTRNEIVTELQKLSNDLKAKNYQGSIGVAYHFKNNSTWVPAKLSTIGDDVDVWDMTDSDRGKLYQDDSIDGIQVYIINKDGSNKFFKPSKQESLYTTNIFAKT